MCVMVDGRRLQMSNWIDSVVMLGIVSMIVAWQQLHSDLGGEE